MRESGVFRGDDDRVLASGRVLLRVILLAEETYNETPGYRAMTYWAESPTERQAQEWSVWAAETFNPGTTHIFPETYDIFTYVDPYFGREVKVIDIGMGS
jgi:hypothetical protein